MDRALLFTIDVEEFVLPREYGVPFDEERAYALGAEGLERMVEPLRRHEVAATLFVTAAFARRHPDLLHELQGGGSEIALHGGEHAEDYAAMPPAVALERLRDARAELQALFGAPVLGYRANRFRSPSRPVLRELGILWTSNLHPAWIPGAYDHRRRPRTIHRDEDLLEVPISVSPRLKLPLSWFWMRNLGLAYVKAAGRRTALDTGYLHVYVHPWECADLPALPGLPLLGRLSMRRTGARFVELLDRFLAWSRRRGHVPATITQHLEQRSLLVLG